MARIRHPYTVMYYVTGDARSADVSYVDARGVTVHVGWVRFPWKVYLHPEKGAHLSVSASLTQVNPWDPGATVGIWVNGKIVSGGASNGDPYCDANAAAVLGSKDTMQYFKGDNRETTEYFGQFPLRP